MSTKNPLFNDFGLTVARLEEALRLISLALNRPYSTNSPVSTHSFFRIDQKSSANPRVTYS
jgi:hypothetical protein